MSKPRTPREHYRREKERRANEAKPESELMAAARREYEALLAAQAMKGKGGRPKKNAAKKAPKKRADPDALVDDLLEDAPDE
jgi:hypothetical protein